MSTISTPLCQYLSHLPEKNKQSQRYEDLLNGKSHEKLAKTIADHIKFCTVETPRTIGIQGKWGSGKSHLIELVSQRLDEQCFHVFKFDLWNYQEEASRRVFLTELLKSLKIIKDLDNIDCHAADKKIGDDVIRQKFEKLFAKQVTKIIENKTPANVNLLIFVLAIALVQPFFSAAVFFQEKCDSLIIFPIWVMLFFFVAILYALTNGYKDDISWKHLAQFQSINEKPIQKSEEYESNNEYSIVEFHNFMNNVSDWFVKCANTKNGNKIIVVFDNIDRVSSDVSVSVWKLILNIISNEKNLNFFYLIPFDKEHLNTGYIGEDKNGFISKIFPIVYKMPEPLNVDIRNYFHKKIKLIFKDISEYEILCLRTLFLNFSENPTLRDVSIFINELRRLNLQFEGIIDLKVKALYLLKLPCIKDNPLEKILRKSYFTSHDQLRDDDYTTSKNINSPMSLVTNELIDQQHISQQIDSIPVQYETDTNNKLQNRQADIMKSMFHNDELLQTQIAALHYGVDMETASYLPLYDYLKTQIRLVPRISKITDSIINQYINHSKFDDIIELLLEDIGIGEIDSLISFFDLLDNNNVLAKKVWHKLVQLKISQGIYYYLPEDKTDILLNKIIDDDASVNKFLDSIMQSINSLVNEYKGDRYCQACTRLINFLQSHQLPYTPKFEVYSANSDFWMSYIIEANGDIDKFINSNNDMHSIINHILTSVNVNLLEDSCDENYFSTKQIRVLNNYFKYANFSQLKLIEYSDKLKQLLTKISNHKILDYTYHYWIRIKKTLFNRKNEVFAENNKFILDLDSSQILKCFNILLDELEIRELTRDSLASTKLEREMMLENFVDLVCFMIVHDMENSIDLLIKEKYREHPLSVTPSDLFSYVYNLADRLLPNSIFAEAVSNTKEHFINVLSDYVDDLECFFNSSNDSNDDFRPMSYKDMLRDYWYDHMNCCNPTPYPPLLSTSN